MSDEPSGPDQIPGAPHPRDTPTLFGQDAAQAAFLDAFNSGRLHHAWLLSGPRGSGKATLAYTLARFLLATPPARGGLFDAPQTASSLNIANDHPVCARILAGSEPGLRVVTRSENEKTKRMRDAIVVDDIRNLGDFFHLSSVDGARRVVIIDTADDLNTAAANALLKMLEEPPTDTTLMLVSHQPSRLLPTIRSRCRTLRLNKLAPDDLAAALSQVDPSADMGPDLAELAQGSVGEALRLINLSGLQIYAELIATLGTLPKLNRARALGLADAAAQRGAEHKRDLLVELLDIAMARLARHGATGLIAPEAAPNESSVFAKLAPDPASARIWAAQSADISARLRHGLAVNVDPAALLLDTFCKLRDTAETIKTGIPV
ncbi:MAG: DNA polymerase III subunit delta' [Pseudomonadota bacterium]